MDTLFDGTKGISRARAHGLTAAVEKKSVSRAERETMTGVRAFRRRRARRVKPTRAQVGSRPTDGVRFGRDGGERDNDAMHLPGETTHALPRRVIEGRVGPLPLSRGDR